MVPAERVEEVETAIGPGFCVTVALGFPGGVKTIFSRGLKHGPVLRRRPPVVVPLIWGHHQAGVHTATTTVPTSRYLTVVSWLTCPRASSKRVLRGPCHDAV